MTNGTALPPFRRIPHPVPQGHLQGCEEKAYEAFKRLRWQETDGEPVCPKCGCLDHYEISTRRKFKCAECGSQFSVTSGSIFASRKMAFTDLLAAICIFVNAAKGLSALQLSRDIDCQYKTAFVLAHKLREALAAETVDATLSGEVEIDGAHFSKTPRQENRAEDRKDRRTKAHQGERRVMVALRQRLGRTLTFVRPTEADGVEIARARMVAGAKLFADEASHWDVLEMDFASTRINHSEAYSDGNGKHTNWVESFFSRLAAWYRASTTTFRTATYTSTPTTPLGSKITVAGQTDRTRRRCSAAR